MEVLKASRADSFSWTFTGGAVIKGGTPTDTATVTVIAGAAGTDLIATATAHNAQGDSDPVDSSAVTVTALTPITADIVFDPAFVQLPDSTCQCSFTNPQGGAGAPYKVVGGGWGLDNYLGSEQIDHDSGLITLIDTAGTLDVSVVIEDKDGNSSKIGAIAAHLEIKAAPEPPHDAVITIDPVTASAASGTTSITYSCDVQGDESMINSYAWFVDGTPSPSMTGKSGTVEIDFTSVPANTYKVQCKILYGTSGLLESNEIDFEVTA